MRLIIFCIFFLNQCYASQDVDVIIFSYDRPMQLYALLESLHHHSTGIHQTSVIYRYSDNNYKNAYAVVSHDFPKVRFLEQINPPYDFQSLVINETFRSNSSNYVTFAVDDMIVTDSIDFAECSQFLEKTHAYGFYLRLGQNIDDCWSSGQHEGIPELHQVQEHIYSWQFKTGIGNWAYPNTVDMTIYRKKDLENHFRKVSFSNPNYLEDQFNEKNLELIGLCYETSKVLNIPLNIVSTTTETKHINLPTRILLDQFNAGLKIDITPLYRFNNTSAHVFTYFPTLVPRYTGSESRIGIWQGGARHLSQTKLAPKQPQLK